MLQTRKSKMFERAVLSIMYLHELIMDAQLALQNWFGMKFSPGSKAFRISSLGPFTLHKKTTKKQQKQKPVHSGESESFTHGTRLDGRNNMTLHIEATAIRPSSYLMVSTWSILHRRSTFILSKVRMATE